MLRHGASAPPQASELHAHADDVRALRVYFSIDGMIALHEGSVGRMEQLIAQHGLHAAGAPEIAQAQQRCALSQWLQDSGHALIGQASAYPLLVRSHARFHELANAWLQCARAGDAVQAERVQKACCHASSQTVLLLRQVQREMEHP